MSLQSRLTALAEAIGADVKNLSARWVYDPNTGWPTRPTGPGGMIANSVRWVNAPPPPDHAADDLWFRHPNSPYVPTG